MLRRIVEALERIASELQQLNQTGEGIMSQLDDLTAAVTQLQTDLTAAIARVVASLQSAPPSPQVAAAITALQAMDASVNALDPATPPPAP
jgi:uncharacterized protein YoxC